MAAIQHPLKMDIEKLGRMVNELHQAYNLYFQGFEKNAPLAKRKDLDTLVTRLRSEVVKANQSSVSFLFRQNESRFQILKNKWDKRMAEIENGTYRIPVKTPQRK